MIKIIPINKHGKPEEQLPNVVRNIENIVKDLGLLSEEVRRLKNSINTINTKTNNRIKADDVELLSLAGGE